MPNGAVMGQSDWRDYTLSLRFKTVSRGTDWRDGPWIGFRYTDPGQAYALDFSNRNVVLHKAYQGAATGDTGSLAEAPWSADEAWHKLAVRVSGNSIAALLDGKPLLSATDSNLLGVGPIPSGGICLCARRWPGGEGHTEVLFDDVRVELGK